MKKNLIGLFGLLLICSTGCAQKQNEKASAQAEATQKNYTVKQLPLTQTEGFLDSIKKEYKGSVTLIDFWATWCGPCRMAMAEVDSIKPDLMEKGVKFVYITGESSPEDKWNEMIQKIDGDHYRLTKEQWSALCKSLKLRGIPAYIILAKDGSEAFNNATTAGYPGNDAVKAALEKELEK